MDEFIKIHRRLKDWKWYGEPGMVALWVHILLSVTCKDGVWEMTTSASKLAKSIGMDVSKVRTGLDRLRRSEAIDLECNNQHTRIIVVNYTKYQEGEAPANPVTKPKPKPTNDDAVERIYKLYPTKCPVKGTSTGKCSKDKVRINTLLKTRSEENITKAIKTYLDDCAKDGRFIKNFSTLLNNLPEVTADEPETKQREQSINALDLVGDW